MAFDIDDLQIIITAESISAVQTISKLASSLRTLSKIELDSSRIRTFVQEIAELGEQGEGLRTVAAELTAISNALSRFKVPKQTSNIASNVMGSNDPQDIMLVEDSPSLSKAGKNVDVFLESIRRLNDAGKDVSGLNNIAAALQSMATSASQLNKVTIAMQQYNKQVKEGSRHTAGFLSTVARLAKVMVLRMILRSIIKGIKDGIQMFINWDRTVNNSMAGAANAVDNLKGALDNLKGSFGALFGTLITTLEPYITWLINALTTVLNFFQQMLRLLQGHNTYYKYIAGSATEAANAASKLKRILFGFDELNVLPSDKEGGGVGAGAMGGYEETEFDSWIQRAQKELEDFFDEEDYQNFPGMLRVWLIGAKGVQYLAEWVWENAIKPTFSWITDTAVPWVSEKATMIWNACKKVFTEDVPREWEKMKENFNKSIGNLWEKIPAKWRNPIEKAFNTVYTYFFEPFSMLLDALRQSVKLLLDFLINPANWFSADAHKKFSSDFQDIWTTTFNTISLKWEMAKNKVEEGLEGLPKTGESALSEFRKEVDNSDFALKLKARVDSKNFTWATNQLLNDVQSELYKNPLEIPTVVSSGSSPRNGSGKQWLNPGKIGTEDEFWGFANGGVPNVGTLFYAGEAGAEVVANMGHRTGVMNIAQMQDAVANGNIEVVNAVYAMANMVANAIKNKDFDVYMDTDKVGQSVSKYQFNQARRGITQGAY